MAILIPVLTQTHFPSGGTTVGCAAHRSKPAASPVARFGRVAVSLNSIGNGTRSFASGTSSHGSSPSLPVAGALPRFHTKEEEIVWPMALIAVLDRITGAMRQC